MFWEHITIPNIFLTDAPSSDTSLYAELGVIGRELFKKKYGVYPRAEHRYEDFKKRTSQYVGVYQNRSNGKKKWHAQLKKNGRSIWLGTFSTEQEAANAYSAAKKRMV